MKFVLLAILLIPYCLALPSGESGAKNVNSEKQAAPEVSGTDDADRSKRHLLKLFGGLGAAKLLHHGYGGGYGDYGGCYGGGCGGYGGGYGSYGSTGDFGGYGGYGGYGGSSGCGGGGCGGHGGYGGGYETSYSTPIIHKSIYYSQPSYSYHSVPSFHHSYPSYPSSSCTTCGLHSFSSSSASASSASGSW